MRFKTRLTGALLAIAATGAIANADGILFLGTDASAAPDEVAFVLFNQPTGHPEEVPTLVFSIGSTDGYERKDTRHHRVAVVAPGEYRVSVACKLTMRDIAMGKTLVFSAGITYTLGCERLTARTVKLSVTETKTPS